MTYQSERNALKEMTLESLFGPPTVFGSTPDRTCATTVVFYRNDSWAGRFDRLRLPGEPVDLTPCKFRRVLHGCQEDGFYRGPRSNRTVPDICKVPNPGDIVEYGPSGEPIYDRSAMKIDWQAEPFGEVLRYNPGCMISDRARFGVYTETRGTWTQVTKPFEKIYEDLHDTAVAGFEQRNEWAAALARKFADLQQTFVITVNRMWHMREMMNRLDEAGLKVSAFHGGLSVDERAAILEKLSKGQLHGVVATHSTISEGVDLPSLVHLIKLDGVTSEQLLTQQLGRVQRTFPGKKRGYLHVPWDLQERRLEQKSIEIRSYFESQRTGVKEIAWA
jgi:hypothetical protein